MMAHGASTNTALEQSHGGEERKGFALTILRWLSQPMTDVLHRWISSSPHDSLRATCFRQRRRRGEISRRNIFLFFTSISSRIAFRWCQQTLAFARQMSLPVNGAAFRRRFFATFRADGRENAQSKEQRISIDRRAVAFVPC